MAFLNHMVKRFFVIFFLLFASAGAADPTFWTTVRDGAIVIAFRFSTYSLDSTSRESNNHYQLIIDGLGLQSVSDYLSLPFFHFSSAVPAEHHQYTIQIVPTEQIRLLLPVPADTSLSPVQITGNDHVFGISTMEWNFYPAVVQRGDPYITLTIAGEIRLRPVGFSLNTPLKAIPAAMNRLDLMKNRIHNLDAFHLQPDFSVFEKVSRISYDFTQGIWVKLRYQNEGLYKISMQELKSVLPSVPETPFGEVRLFSYQGEDLPVTTTQYPEGLKEIVWFPEDNNNNGIWDNNEYIYFYARPGNHFRFDGNDFEFQEYYFDNNFYIFLNIGSQTGITRDTVRTSTGGNVVVRTSTPVLFHYERNLNNVLSGGLEWYDHRFNGTSDQKSLTFTLPLTPLSGSEATVELAFRGGTGSFWSERIFATYNFSVALNSNTIASDISFSRNANYVRKVSINGDLLKKENNSLVFTYTANTSSAYAYFDYLEIRYEAGLNYEGKVLTVITPFEAGVYRFSVSGAGGSAGEYTGMDVTDPFAVRWIPLRKEGETLIWDAETENMQPRIFMICKKTDIPSVDRISPILPHSNLRDANYSHDLIIITPPEFEPVASKVKTLYETHLLNPLRTFIATTDQIYLEFSSGSVHPLAFRNFIRHVVLNGSVIPSYVLLLGNGHFDYKGILYPTPNFIPPYEKDTNYELTTKPLDILLTDIDRSTASLSSVVPDIPIGRIPAESVEDAEAYLEKLQHYESISPENLSENTWRTRVLLVADDEVSTFDKNEYYHLGYSEAMIQEGRIPTYLDILKLYLADYPLAPGGLGRAKPQATDALIDYINNGTMLINYFGHGSPTTWAHETVFVIDRDRDRIQNGFRLPIIVAGTCDFGTFDQPNHPSASVQLLNMRGRGAIGVISASRPSFAFGNRDLVSNLFSRFFTSNRISGTNTLGNAFTRTMAVLNGNDNSQNYNILGIPMLSPIRETLPVRIDSLSADTLKALSEITFYATVVDSSLVPVNDFHGKCYVLLRDASSDTLYSGPYPYQHSGPAIFKGIYQINGGKIQGKFIIPKSIRYKNEASGKLMLFAVDENNRTAIGIKDQLVINGSLQGVVDTKGPEISMEFPENPNFISGDILPPGATIVIKLSDPFGINTTGESGHEIMLIIDDKQLIDITEFFLYNENSYQEGIIRYALPSLSQGRHSLKIRAWDNVNNVSEMQINFEVVSGFNGENTLQLLHVVNYPNPMQKETWFTFSLLNPEPMAIVTIRIYTLTGRKIRELRETLSSPQGFQKIYWDGYDEDGNRPANGVYLYKISIDNGVKKAEKREKLVILN